MIFVERSPFDKRNVADVVDFEIKNWIRTNLYYISAQQRAAGKDVKQGTTQARNQVLRFGGKNKFLVEQDFVFIICLKLIFLGTAKFGKHKNS